MAIDVYGVTFTMLVAVVVVVVADLDDDLIFKVQQLGVVSSEKTRGSFIACGRLYLLLSS